MPLVVETEHKVTIHNDTDARIEFYSLDFDKQYLEEEDILRRVQLYEAGMVSYNDVILLPLRPPKSDLQAGVLDAWAPILAAEEAEQKAADEARIKAEAAEAARLKAEEGDDAEEPSDRQDCRPKRTVSRLLRVKGMRVKGRLVDLRLQI